MRCPDCNAFNPADAAWCGQCLRRFAPPAATAGGDPPDTADAAGNPAAPPAQPDVPLVPPPPGEGAAAFAEPPVGHEPTGARGVFVTVGGRVRWRCPVCETLNEVEELACPVCGTALSTGVEPPAPVDWDHATRRAILGPGLGHIVAGRPGGWPRLLLAAAWLLGALLLLGGGGVTALPAAVPLLLGGVVLWAGSVLDVVRLSQGQSELLHGRALLWLVVGVVVLLVAGVVATVPTGGP